MRFSYTHLTKGLITIGLFKRRKRQEIRADTSGETRLLQWLETDCQTLTRAQAMEIPTVSACIAKIGETISRLPVKLYRKDGEEVTEITEDHRIPLLNGETGDTLSTVDMWKAVTEDYFLGSGGWIFVDMEGLSVRSLRYVDCRSVSFITNTDPIFKAFQVLVNGQRYYDFQFIRLLRRTRDGWTNITLQEENSRVLSAAWNSLRLENTMNENGGCKPGFLKSKDRISTETIEKIKAGYRRVFANQNTKGEILVLNDGIDFEPVSATAAELQMNENKRANSVEICKLFGFPHTVIDGGASEDDNRKFTAAVVAMLNQIETALDSVLLLESEKEQGFYWAFDTKELTRGSMLERYQAYEIARRNNILQIDEIRREEDYEPLGFNFITLNLSDVLLNPETMEVFTPNTGQTQSLEKGEVRARGDNWTKGDKGLFTGSKGSGGGSSGSGGGKSGKKVDKSQDSGIIKAEDVSALGENSLRIKGFLNKQKLNNHWQNGRTHADEYEADGITTKDQYEQRGVELAESAADGVNILGYKTKEGYICRYDVKRNDYVKADVNKGLRTLFKPTDGIDYFNLWKSKEGVEE